MRYQLGLQSSERLTGAGESTSKMAHSHGCWKEASVPCHVSLPVEPISFPTWQLASSRAGDLRERARKKLQCFYDTVSKVTYCHFIYLFFLNLHHIPFIRSKSLSPAYTQGKESKAPPLEGRSIKGFVNIV